MVPSIVNKFYVFDLAPGRSIVEYFVQNGMTVFMMAWRNPQPRHDRWGMTDYQDAIDAAIDATRDPRHAEGQPVGGLRRGPVAVSLAGYYAARRRQRINSLLLLVSPLDTQAMSDAPPSAPSSTVTAPRHPGRSGANCAGGGSAPREFTVLFAMLRANDLIWNYWVSDYLMGETPSAFDVLYWNEDGTGMTAQFNHDFSEFVDTIRS